VIWQRSGAGRDPVGMRARWKQVRRAGVVGLHPFTAAELGAVVLDAQAVPEAERGPFLQVVAPLLAAPGTAGTPPAAAGPDTPAPMLPGWATSPDDATAGAAAVTRLERLGFLRSGAPAATARAAPAGLAGWAVSSGGDLRIRRPVTLLGDLAIITRIRAQPVWVAEVTVSPAPARPSPPADGWPVLARMYAPHRPRVGLVEQPPGTGPELPPYVLVRQDRVVPVLAGWCGTDLADGDEPAGAAGSEAGPLIPMPTAEVSGAFAAVTQLRVAVAQGPGVLLRTLAVASGQGRHWLLEGNRWQRAVPISADGLAGQVATLLRLPADGENAGRPVVP
jgi:hypothetical protein